MMIYCYFFILLFKFVNVTNLDADEMYKSNG